jgi:molecular chaperone DnaK (HSP70)
VAPADCEEIGNAVLSLPPGLPADAPIEITFDINEQGRLHAQARELSANRSIKVEIHTGRVLSGDQLERARQRSRQIVVW